jgi:hypothetical protein
MSAISMADLSPRGALSGQIMAALRHRPTDDCSLPFDWDEPRVATVEAARGFLQDGDAQLALELLYSLHYRGLPDVDGHWEWHPGVMSARRRVEEVLEQAVALLARERLGRVDRWDPSPARCLQALTASDDSRSVATHVMRHASIDQVRDCIAQKSLYHLKEADSQTWMIPRLVGRAKGALIEIQVDEYGSGRPGQLHQEMYAGLMAALGLKNAEAEYLPQALPEMLAFTNVMSLYGLHRRHRGRLVGHLAAVEMTSSLPSRKMSRGLQRLGLSQADVAFFDEHVVADAVHEQIAAVDLAGSLVADEPDQKASVIEGAAVYLCMESLLAEALFRYWDAGRLATAELSPDNKVASYV